MTTAPGNQLLVRGGNPLRGTVRIGGAKNAALPIMAAALPTRETCVIHNVPRIIEPEHLEPVIFKLEKMGACVTVGDNTLRCAWPDHGGLHSVDIQAIHFPGFPTDLQAVFGALLTQAQGTSTIHERVFENRLSYVSELNALGATIEIDGQTARVHGPTPLHGASVRALDIRSGAAVILAALAAEDESQIRDIHHVDRGYEDFVPILTELGADIVRGDRTSGVDTDTTPLQSRNPDPWPLAPVP